MNDSNHSADAMHGTLAFWAKQGIDLTEKRLCESMKQQKQYLVAAFLDKQLFSPYPFPEKKQDLPKEDKQLMQ